MSFLKKNLGLKLMALIISLVVWTYVESQVLILDHVQVPFEVIFTNLPPDLTAPVGSVTRIQATGPPDIIKDIRSNMAPDLSAHKLILIVDLSRAVPGQNTYGAIFDHRRLPYEGVTWDSPQVTVNVEEKHYTAPLPIGVDPLTLPPLLNLNRDKTKVIPPKARVSGRLADINKVSRLVVQVQIQASNDPNKMLQNVVVQAKDALGQPVTNVEIDPSTVDVYAALIAANGKRDVFISVPHHGELPPGLELSSLHYTPSHVLISEQQEDVGAVQSLYTTPVNFADLKEGTHSFKVRIIPPKDSSIQIDDRVVRVTVTVKAYSIKTPPTPISTPPKPANQVIPPSVPAH